MYRNPSASAGQWSPNGPPPPQIPAPSPNNAHNQWPPQHHPAQPNGQYAQRPPPNQIPPISQALPQGPPPSMTTLQPQHPDQYRSLPPPPMYGHPQYHPQPPLPYPPQPAPRQRTAIACRYCRRRKIRCSGFDKSEDGRCTNCQRFSQECVFTPVSAQTQAFVPAHTVWRNQGAPPQQLYGAYGQPLPQQHAQYAPQQAQPQQQQQQHAYPPPGAPYPGQPMYPMPPAGVPQGMPQTAPPQAPTPQPQEVAGRKRTNDEPHTPTLPPPNPANGAPITHQHRTSTGEQPHYTYPDPTGLTPAAASPASSTASFHSTQPAAQPYYASQVPPRRPSPQSYQYDPSRTSSSPHNLATSSTPGSYPSAPPATSNPASQPHPGPGQNTSPNGQPQSGRGVRINELIGPSGQQQQPSQAQAQAQAQPQSQPQTPSQAPSQAPSQPQQPGQQNSQQAQQSESDRRSAADSDMLNQLNKQRM